MTSVLNQVCERIVLLVSPLLLLRTGILFFVNFVLPALLGTSMGNITGSSITLATLNDPSVTDSNIEYLEIITQLTVAGELLITHLTLAWLLSTYSWRHWELSTTAAQHKEQTKRNVVEGSKEVGEVERGVQ